MLDLLKGISKSVVSQVTNHAYFYLSLIHNIPPQLTRYAAEITSHSSAHFMSSTCLLSVNNLKHTSLTLSACVFVCLFMGVFVCL